MPHRGKKYRASAEKVNRDAKLPPAEAVKAMLAARFAKFDETVDVDVRLGVDPRNAEQQVRGTVALPHGTGKKVRVAVFAKGDRAEAAKAAGADVVGMEDLAERIQGGDLNFNVVIASPDAMRVVGKLGQILGPRGLMPNPKVGTVSPDVAGAVKNAKAGQVRYKADKAGTVHCSIGKVSFEVDALKANLTALLMDINKSRPASAKGVFMQQVSVSSTMGPGVTIDQTSVIAEEA